MLAEERVTDPLFAGSVDDLMESVPCSICGADDYAVVYRAFAPRGFEEVALTERFAASSGVSAGEQVVRCRRCGLVYMNPRINRALILSGYAEADNSSYVSQSEGRLRTFRRGVDLLAGHLQGATPRLLDVGCAGGFFLKTAQERGWDVYGVEPSRWLTEYARGLRLSNVVTGTLHDAKYPDNFFDAVTYWDVLEHTADPSRELAEVNRIMRPGGVLLVNYPDFSSVWARLLRRRWWFLLSVHLYYFTPSTMARLLRKTGFEPFDSRLHFQYLSFGYLIYRFRAYAPRLAAMMERMARAVGVDRRQILYYASQTNVLARKMDRG